MENVSAPLRVTQVSWIHLNSTFQVTQWKHDLEKKHQKQNLNHNKKISSLLEWAQNSFIARTIYFESLLMIQGNDYFLQNKYFQWQGAAFGQFVKFLYKNKDN